MWMTDMWIRRPRWLAAPGVVRRRRWHALLIVVSVLLVACGARQEQPEVPRLSVHSDPALEVPPSGGDSVREEEPQVISGTRPELPRACSLLSRTDTAALAAAATTIVDERLRCEWAASEGPAVVLVLERYQTLGDALRRFQEIGEPLAAPEGLGAVALLRADGQQVLTVGVFLEGWQLSLSAPAPAPQLEADGAGLVAAVKRAR